MRILIRELPTMLRQIVEEAISHQADMELTNDVDAASRPDVVIAGTHSTAETIVPLDLLERWPRSRVLMLAVNGREATIFELRPHMTPVGDLSPSRLIEVIHAASAWSAG